MLKNEELITGFVHEISFHLAWQRPKKPDTNSKYKKSFKKAFWVSGVVINNKYNKNTHKTTFK